MATRTRGNSKSRSRTHGEKSTHPRGSWLPRFPKKDPTLGITVVVLGCLLSFYLIGLLVIPMGVWLLPRAARTVA